MAIENEKQVVSTSFIFDSSTNQKKKKYLIQKHTKIPIYDIRFSMIATNHKKRLKNDFYIGLKKNNFACVVEHYVKVKDEHFTSIFLIVDIANKYNVLDIGVVVHEAFHVVENVFKLIGETHKENTETKAYLIEYVTNLILNFLKEVEGNLLDSDFSLTPYYTQIPILKTKYD